MSTKKSIAITPSLREELRASIRVDAHARALMNAVTNSNLRSLALNREIMSCHTSFFSHKVEAGKVTNQNRSGRCWLFAALNILRPKIMEKHHLEDFEFSENYLFFWDKMEKANFFLESIIHFRDRALEDRKVKFLLQDPFADGGQWSFVAALVEKYGLVPRYAMDETANSRDSSVMDEVISSLLRHDAALLRDMHREGKGERELRTKKEAMLRDVYRVLVFCLGAPPDTLLPASALTE
jgi:bleomycin hydrolase